MQINDCKRDAMLEYLDGQGVTTAGYEHINDLTHLWLSYQIGAPISPPQDVMDLWERFFDLQGIDPGDFNDRAFNFLTDRGYTGALDDMWYVFFCVDGGSVDFPAWVTHGGILVTHKGARVSHGFLHEDRPVNFSVEWITNPITEANQENCEVRVYFDPVVNLGDRYHLFINGDVGQFKYRTGLCTAPSGNFVVAGIDCSGFANGAVSAYVNIEDTVTGEGQMFGPDNALKTTRIPVFLFDPDDYVIGEPLGPMDEWNLELGAATDMEIVAGQFIATTVITQAVFSANVEIEDGYNQAIGWTVPDGYAAQSGLIGFHVDTDNRMGIRAFGGQVECYEMVAGAWGNKWMISQSIIPGDNIIFAFDNGVPRCYYNGIMIQENWSFDNDYLNCLPSLIGESAAADLTGPVAIWDLTIPAANYGIDWVTNPITEITETAAALNILFNPIYGGMGYDLEVMGGTGDTIVLSGTLPASGPLLIENLDCSVFDNGSVMGRVNINSLGWEYRSVLKVARIPVYVVEFSDYPEGTDILDIPGWSGPGSDYLRVDAGGDLASYSSTEGGFLQATSGSDPTNMAVGAKMQYLGPSTGLSDFPVAIGFDHENFIGIRYYNNQIDLYERIGGTFGSLFIGGTQAIGDTIILATEGTDVAIFQNGEEVFRGPYTIDLTGALPAYINRSGTGKRISGYAVWDLTEDPPNPPEGYDFSWSTDPITPDNETAAEVAVTDAEIDASYTFTVTGVGTPVEVTGIVVAEDFDIINMNVSGLEDGTLTGTLVLENEIGPGDPVEHTVDKDTVIPPAGYNFSWTTDPITAYNYTAAEVAIIDAEIGSSYNFTVSGTGDDVVVSGTVTDSDFSIPDMDVSGLDNGTLTGTLVLTNSAGPGDPVIVPVEKNAVVPPPYEFIWTTDPIDSSNQFAAAVAVTAAEIDATYNFTVSGVGDDVEESGTVVSTDFDITGMDVSLLDDGTLTGTLVLTNPVGSGTPAVHTVEKDTYEPPDPPSGYEFTWTTDPIDETNETAAEIAITDAEVGAAYNFTITGPGTPVEETGTVATPDFSIPDMDVSGFDDGTLTGWLILTNEGGAGSEIQHDVEKYTVVPPEGYDFSWVTDPIDPDNETAAEIAVTGAEVDASYNFTVSGVGDDVVETGTVLSPEFSIPDINVSGLDDGVLTGTLILSNIEGPGTPAVHTVEKDTAVVPEGYDFSWTTDPIDPDNETAAAIAITDAEIGAGYVFTVSGVGDDVVDSGTITVADFPIIDLNVSGFADGTLTGTLVLTNAVGPGIPAVHTVEKDTVVPPSGYEFSWTTDPIDETNETAAEVAVTGAEIDATYSFIVTGDGAPVEEAGTVTSVDFDISDMDVSGLADGTLTGTLVLTNSAGPGDPAIQTVEKETEPGAGFVGSIVQGSTIYTLTENIMYHGQYTATPGPVNRISAYLNSTIGNLVTMSLFNSTGAVVAYTSITIDSDALQWFSGLLNTEVILTDAVYYVGCVTNIAGQYHAEDEGNGQLAYELQTFSPVPAPITPPGDVVNDFNLSAYCDYVEPPDPPSGYDFLWITDPIDETNETEAAVAVSGAEIDAGYSFIVSGDGTDVERSGTVVSADFGIEDMDVSGLADGTLTGSLVLSNVGGPGDTVEHTVEKDTEPSPPAIIAQLDCYQDDGDPLDVGGEVVTADSITHGVGHDSVPDASVIITGNTSNYHFPCNSTNGLLNTNVGSIQIWFKQNNPVANGHIFAQSTSNNIFRALRNELTAEVYFFINEDSVIFAILEDIFDGSWWRLTFTWDNSLDERKLFVGDVEYSIINPWTQADIPAGNLWIGNRMSLFASDAEFQDFKIYDGVITP